MEEGKGTATINDYLTYYPARAVKRALFSSSTSTTNPKHPRDLVGVEINTWENFADSVQEESKKALARESEVKLEPLHEVYGYLSINHLQYGVLCTYNKFFFMRRLEGAASSKLEITGAILRDQTQEEYSFTLMEAWLTIIMAAEHNYVITSPHVSPAGKVRLLKKPMELFDGLKLGNLYVGERRTRSQLGVIVDGGLRGDNRETILKIVDTCNSTDKGKKLEVEVSAYRALKELQAEIIPKVIGFFMIHGWVMVLVLQKCGKKIEGCQFGEHYQQIISMVKQIHTGGVAHGDIALRNILIDTEGKLTIIDFSEARLRNSCSEEEFLACCKEDLDAMEYLFQSHPPKN